MLFIKEWSVFANYIWIAELAGKVDLNAGESAIEIFYVLCLLMQKKIHYEQQ